MLATVRLIDAEYNEDSFRINATSPNILFRFGPNSFRPTAAAKNTGDSTLS